MAANICYIDLDREKRNTAGAKAPDDIAELCALRGYKRYVVPNFPTGKNKIYQKVWLAMICTGWWAKLGKQLRNEDIVIFQHPMYGKRVAAKMITKIKRKVNCKFIAVIHDLESLRGGIEGVINKNVRTNHYGDNDLLMRFDAIICHNEHMRQYMIKQGFNADKLVNLEIFDYLCETEGIAHSKTEKPSIAIAGNLAIGKCGYIYSICDGEHNKDLIVHLYGNNFPEEAVTENLIWHGSFKPEELPKHLTGDFGLVWDGTSAEICAGNTGEYLRYNNPHKTSLYLAAGMPVIVWSQAAIADFITSRKVGITVDGLYDLEKALCSVLSDDYADMKRNAETVAQELRRGFYFYNALDKCLRLIDESK